MALVLLPGNISIAQIWRQIVKPVGFQPGTYVLYPEGPFAPGEHYVVVPAPAIGIELHKLPLELNMGIHHPDFEDAVNQIGFGTGQGK